MTGRHRSRHHQRGAVLLIAFMVLALTAIAGQAVYAVQVTAAKRERELQLLFAGDQYRRAIQSYYNTVPPNGARALPSTLDDLLIDNRFPTPVHHLRRLYADPMTGKADWQLVRAANGIQGVRSNSADFALKRAGFCSACQDFGGKEQYGEWTFVIKLN